MNPEVHDEQDSGATPDDAAVASDTTAQTSNLDDPPPPTPGLTTAEAAQRRAAGQGNDAQIRTGRTYGQIIRENVFNFINNLFYVMGALLLILGKPLDAFVVVGVITANTVISLFQEIRAKRVMDRIAILMRPKATVLRDGTLVDIDPSQIVVGDALYVHPGDQVVVDGPMLGPGRMEVDESLLTGESDLVAKNPGDPLLSGSFCVTGGGYYEAEMVGLSSFANKLLAKATTYTRELTPLQRQISRIVRTLLLVVVAFEILVWIRNTAGGIPFVESVRMSTVILALIPNGLVLSIALTYALGAVRLLGQNILVQRFNAIESLSNVDVLCTDKTGTLTSGVITLEEIAPLGAERARVERLLGVFAATSSDANKTIMAIRTALPQPHAAVLHEAVFSSARKWSGLAFSGEEDAELRGTYVFGAPEMVAPALAAGTGAWQEQADAWATRGLRVLLLAGSHEPVPFRIGDGQPQLPPDLAALGLICFSDELRPGVRDTLDGFSAAGIEVKIVSGDNPKTVSALAAQAGIGATRVAGRAAGDSDALPHAVAISGPELEELDPSSFGEAAEAATVFGRVTPEQKEELVQTLRGRGRYVAMIGDGVNDVIALKQANVAVGMQGGSQAARGVADLILLNDTFAPLPYAFREGQRIINGMNDILHIFLVRICFKASIIAAITALGGFPFAPRQASLVSFVSAGVPAFALAIWARSGPTPKVGLFKLLARFVLPTALLLLLTSVGVYEAFAIPAKDAYLAAHPAATDTDLLENAYPVAQTALTLYSSFCSILLILFAVPPTKWFAGGAKLRGDWRFVGVVFALLAFVVAVLAIPLGRYLFELEELPVWQYFALFGASLLWAALCHLVWRSRMLDRWLGTVEDPGNVLAKERARETARRRTSEGTLHDDADTSEKNPSQTTDTGDHPTPSPGA
ncbi:MAG: HAD-IC family P-type ATPase [Thermoleophilia bacterium]